MFEFECAFQRLDAKRVEWRFPGLASRFASLTSIRNVPDSRNAFLLPLLLLVLGRVLAADEVPTVLRQPADLDQQLQAADRGWLVDQIERRGDAERGAIVFHRAEAACSRCHHVTDAERSLGPALTQLPRKTSTADVVSSILEPSKEIADAFRATRLLTVDGRVLTGLVATDDDAAFLQLRSLDAFDDPLQVARDDVEARSPSPRSLMPDQLAASLAGPADFFDLVAYVTAVARGGPAAAARLQPTAEQLRADDDTFDLDHAGILRSLGRRDFEAGQRIYRGYCAQCHGEAGNQPSLPTARAFGREPLKYGDDPYALFVTLSKGNGLMAPMRHLAPRERYQVIHYLREALLPKPDKADRKLSDAYLDQLPKGTRDGSRPAAQDRDFGPALASQLRRQYPSVLSVSLDPLTLAIDTQTMGQVGLWEGAFVDHSQTQHSLDRGEGTVNPGGPPLRPKLPWRWRHDPRLVAQADRRPPRGPQPTSLLDYHGYSRAGNQIVLHYTVDGRELWQLARSTPAASSPENDDAPERSLVQHLHVAPGNALRLTLTDPLGDSLQANLVPVEGPSRETRVTAETAPREVESVLLKCSSEDAKHNLWLGVAGQTAGTTWQVFADQTVGLVIPKSKTPRVLRIVSAWRKPAADRQGSSQPATWWQSHRSSELDPRTVAKQTQTLWPETLTTTGYLGLETGAYAIDTLTLPKATPWNTWFRTSGLDFFKDGRLAVCTYGGDVWIVSGVDQDLEELRWKRFAGGLYEPMGLRIIDDLVYVTCKDRIVRLHDTDGDNEADYYENFSADTDVSVNFHAFNFDLQSTPDGHLYYAKAGHGADYALPGAIIEITSDGKQRRVYATGFRSPNGMGVLPDGRLTVSDNQGQWIPASKVNLLRRGGFYGWVPSYGYPGKWAPDGGRLDLEQVTAPETFDQPIVWMPQHVDNSSGGQVYAGDARFGPLHGKLLHTSFGKGWICVVHHQEIDSGAQAAVVRLPLDFNTGIMRARVNPHDGQVYATGLQGWNGGGRPGLADGGIQRLRFTGRHAWMITDAEVRPAGLHLRFSEPIDPASATPSAFTAQAWDYRWSRSYGSDMYLPGTDQQGQATWPVEEVQLDPDHRGVTLVLADLQPVDQLHLVVRLRDPAGSALREELFWTIQQLPDQ